MVRQGRPDGLRASERVWVRPNQIYNWKKQLFDGAASVFEGGTSAEGVINEAQVDLLYRQIGQLKVENDFFGTQARQLSRAERRAMIT